MAYEIVSGDYDDDDDLALVSGDDVDLILGAYRAPFYGGARAALARPSRRAPVRGMPRGRAGYGGRGALQAAMQQRLAHSGVLLREQAPTRSGRIVLGLNSTGTVAAGASANITARPQSQAFKPERIVIPSSIAPDFTIQDIKCGNVSQLAQSGDLAAEAFVQTTFGGELDFATVQTSQDFVMSVTNISGAARTFRAVIYGHAAY